jgi:two-component system, cell cycle sensor histidine kinase and response regulator CckA
VSTMPETGTSHFDTYGTYPPQIGQEVQDHERRHTHNCWETILLVEDEAYVRDVTREVLEMCGYTVVSAKNAAEAIRFFEEYEGVIHLLVTDVVMPGMDGRELAKRLTERCPELRAIFISGYTDNAVVRNGFRDPNTVYLQKPFTLDSLARKVREVIDGIPHASPRRVN